MTLSLFDNLSGTYILFRGNAPKSAPQYQFREGDYSTQVNVHILSWREWVLGYFPPPEDRHDQQGSQLPPREPRHDNQGSPTHNSSSSSSNGGASEPTLDFSCLSPTSNRLISDSKAEWRQKTPSTQGEPKERGKDALPRSHLSTLPAFSEGATVIRLLLHDRSQLLATVDQTNRGDLQGAHLSIRVSIPSPVPNPITQSFLSLLTTLRPDTKTSGELPRNPATLLLSSYSTKRLTHKGDWTEKTLNLTLLGGSGTYDQSLSHFKQGIKDTGPLQPKAQMPLLTRASFENFSPLEYCGNYDHTQAPKAPYTLPRVLQPISPPQSLAFSRMDSHNPNLNSNSK